MNMDYEAWRFWTDILQTVLTAMVGIYFWLVTRTRVNATRIKKLEDGIDKRLDGHDDRLARLESAIEHGPKREDFKLIYDRIDDVNKTISEVDKKVSQIEGENQAMANSLHLINQHLLERRS